MMRHGFSLLIALAFLVAIAIIGALTMMTVATSTKETKNLYLYEQAQLYARSAAEYAILKIQEHDFSSEKCLKTVNAYFDRLNENESLSDKNALFSATVQIKYIAADNFLSKYHISGCDNNIIKNGNSDGRISAVVLYVRVQSNNDGEQVSYSRVTTQIP